MAVSSLLRLLFFFVFFIIFVDGQCLDDQKKLLLDLRSEFKFNSSISRALVKWNETGDCCKWRDVGCDDSGRVISLNLYDEGISGRIDLDLSNNHLQGDIPSWIWGTGMSSLNLSLNLLTDFQKPYHIPGSLQTLDLHSNLLSCEFPLLRPHANESDYDFANFLFLANNRLTGVVPTSICNIPRLKVLDLSFNNLNGSIPPCLLEEGFYLKVLNLRGNNIIGVISDTIIGECALNTFDVSDNNLGGKIPKSLANCNYLAVMNVGNNNFEDSFPCMALSESLKVLVLRSNRFHGELRCGKSWPDLQILDISSNNFSGTLNQLNISSLRGMMLQSQARRPTRSASDILSVNNLYRDEVTIILKNVEVKLVKIWPDFTSIDLSSNHFQGEIPDAIGNLTSLYLLNLSHNSLTNAIPRSLGALTELGSLDLSSNKLTGRIPEELTKLDFLSFLNLSYNHLIGPIPTGRQFQTFSADSYVGNTGLSGLPLNGSFNNRRPPASSPSEDSESKDEEIKWEYVFAAFGYVVGFGSFAWILSCCRSLRERYFEKIEEVADKTFYERGRRKRHERRLRRRREEKKRREERRNGLRRYHE
ncbi:receptor-like protein 33 [Salvia hispanica]|uniref:receptor-like protein 33 n=1 Tax=Salvia hispanica TaxID=49212 RepID=UPI0020098B59|nr:receptor-like protein 33 [Salvia hispanica]